MSTVSALAAPLLLSPGKIDLARRARGHFLAGMDSAQIAKAMGIEECEAHRLCLLGRCLARNLPVPAVHFGDLR